MTSSGLPELTGIQDLRYVVDALQIQATDAEATIFFTRLIESSLGSVATKFNFFIHNLAQRFSGLPSSDDAILSFSPKTYSLKQDGRIREVSVFTYHKRYNPDKFYIYVVRVIRDGQDDSSFIFRTFDEFQELHNKLTLADLLIIFNREPKEIAFKATTLLGEWAPNWKVSIPAWDIIHFTQRANDFEVTRL